MEQHHIPHHLGLCFEATCGERLVRVLGVTVGSSASGWTAAVPRGLPLALGSEPPAVPLGSPCSGVWGAAAFSATGVESVLASPSVFFGRPFALGFGASAGVLPGPWGGGGAALALWDLLAGASAAGATAGAASTLVFCLPGPAADSGSGAAGAAGASADVPAERGASPCSPPAAALRTSSSPSGSYSGSSRSCAGCTAGTLLGSLAMSSARALKSAKFSAKMPLSCCSTLNGLILRSRSSSGIWCCSRMTTSVWPEPSSWKVTSPARNKREE